MRPGTQRRRAAATGVVVVAAAAVVGVVTALQPGAAAAVAAAALGLAVLVSLMRSSPGPTGLRDRPFLWISLAWAFILIRPIGHFTEGRTALTAVAGVPSIENVIDLAAYGVIAGLAIWSLRRNRLGMQPSWLILALPALAVLSAAWSLAPTVTLGFSFQLIAIFLLATLTVTIRRLDPALGNSILRRSLRLAVQGLALLAVLGLVFPYTGGVSARADGEVTRFAWPGQHPLPATAAIGFALLVVLFATRAEIGFSPPYRVALAGLFGACLYLGESRTAFAGLAAAVLFGVWFVARRHGWARRLAGVGAIVAIVFLIASIFGGPITDYLYRGQTEQQVYGFNGRFGLWALALEQLHTPEEWLFGYGLGATRVLLSSSVAWAGDAHGAWIELLLSLGLVGTAVAVILIGTLAVRLFRSASEKPLASRVIPILFVYVLAMSPAATGFAAPGPEPGLGFALLAFCYAATAARRGVPLRAFAPRGIRPATDFSPAPVRRARPSRT